MFRAFHCSRRTLISTLAWSASKIEVPMSGSLWNIEAEFNQASQMGKLNQRADRVVAWVGREEQESSPEPSPKDAAEAVAFMEVLKEEVHRIYEEHYHLGPAKNEESEYLSPDYALIEPLVQSLEVV
jgi:hypothetical protein